jgi:hypothetical protein
MGYSHCWLDESFFYLLPVDFYIETDVLNGGFVNLEPSILKVQTFLRYLSFTTDYRNFLKRRSKKSPISTILMSSFVPEAFTCNVETSEILLFTICNF